MRAIVGPSILLSVALTACDAGTAVAPAPDASFAVSASAAGALPSRAIRGTCEAAPAGQPVFVPPILHQVSEGTCQLSHLGRTRLHTVAQINMLTMEQTANITYTAANGDLLYGRSAGYAVPAGAGVFTFTGQTHFEGGTGRFTSAIGMVDVAGTLNVATGAARFDYDGWIRYAASHRAAR